MTIAVRGLGGLVCTHCGYAVAPLVADGPIECPACSSTSFKRARAFERPTADLEQVAFAEGSPAWLADARLGVAGAGPHLAWEADGEVHTVPVPLGWAKIGRSGGAEIRLDDPTVSRRHALVVRTEEGKLKALDDRSLNGLFVNGERVEWVALANGDELEIGRFKLYVIT
jgi:DNA-directed RNA polymerase subunit RPC12/RpoP